MLVLAAVPDVQFHKLRRAAGSRFSVAQASTWDDVLASIRGRPVELAVVGPDRAESGELGHRDEKRDCGEPREGDGVAGQPLLRGRGQVQGEPVPGDDPSDG